MSIDPRDLFVSLNPLGLDERELAKDSTGFADIRTHGDYLVFLAGYKAGTVDGEKRECQSHRPINAEGCKPESSIQPSGTSCGDAAPCRSLDKAEGGTPDLKSPIHPDDMARITKWHSGFLKLTDYAWPDDISSLQDEAYALGRIRGQNDRFLTPTTAKSTELTDALPTVAVEGDQLVIRITTESLLHAVTCAPEWPVDYRGDPVSIQNGTLLIQEIIHELQREDEQGSNQMHRLLDQAALDAINNGSEAVSFD